MKLSLSIAAPNEAGVIAELSNKTAQHLTELYGKGHWSYQTSEKSATRSMTGKSKVLVAKTGNEIVGTLCLQTKKPWAIDVSYFTKVVQPLYLIGMAVHPQWQRKGIGRYMLEEIRSFVTAWPAQSIRLDAYNSEAGAGEFYRKCGYVEKGQVIYRGNPLIYFESLM